MQDNGKDSEIAMDVKSLEASSHWPSMEELLEVVSFHLPRYEQTVKTCQNDPSQVNPSDLNLQQNFWPPTCSSRLKDLVP